MKLKRVLVFTSSVLAVLAFQFCEGPAGPAGADGTDGADGIDATGLAPAGTYFSIAVNNNAGDMQHGSFVNYLAFSDTDATVTGTTIPQVLSLYTTTPPEIDGQEVTGEWSATAANIALERITDFEKYDGISPVGVTSVSVKSMFDEMYIYFQLSWTDAENHYQKDKLTYDATTGWDKDGNEDRFYFMFPINGFSGSDFADGSGCEAFCHYDETSANGKGYMFTENSGQLVDTWQWKAARSNPIGFIHDKHLIYSDSVAFGASVEKPKSFSGRKGDQGQDMYVENKIQSNGFPAYMHENDPGANASYPSFVQDFVAFDTTATFSDGATIPGLFLRVPTGSNADVAAQGTHTGSGWFVEVRRPRNTGFGDDHQFLP